MVPAHLIPALAVAANNAIDVVLRTGATRHGQSKPTGEVGFVAAVVLGGVPALARAWRNILNAAGYSVQISGVFCHQSPQATFEDSPKNYVSCELADLLIVVDDLTGGCLGRRWAVLIQAKMAASGGGQTLSASGDLRQLKLLSNWPDFTLPAGFAPGKRDFSTCAYAGVPLDCGRYGLIAPQPNPDWHQQAPATAMPAGGDQLGTFLANMVAAGQTGYGREATGTGDDWSRTVEELMTVTYASAFNYAAGFPGPQSRGHTAIAFASSSLPSPLALLVGGYPYSVEGDVPPSGGRPEYEDEGPSPGISVLRIGIARHGPEE